MIDARAAEWPNVPVAVDAPTCCRSSTLHPRQQQQQQHSSSSSTKCVNDHPVDLHPMRQVGEYIMHMT
jgi:hypothetical protein